MRLDTPRALLRDFRASDLDALHRIFSDAETMRYVEPPFTREQTQRFLQDFCIKQKKAFAAVEKSSGALIGYLLFKPCGEPDVFEIGWILHREFWRRGYAFALCAALLRYGFGTMGLHKIFAETTDPVKSVGLMKKLGMRPEGVQRSQVRDQSGAWADLYLYGLLRDDYFSSI